MRVGQRDTQLSSLRTIEPTASYRYTMYHIAPGYAAAEFLVGMNHVGVGDAEIAAPTQVIEQGPLHGKVAHGITPGIEVEQSVEADADVRADERACRSKRLQSATGADTHYFQLPELRLLLTRLEVDVGQGIQLVDHNVDVVAPDAGREHGDAFTLVTTCNGLELTAFYFALAVLEMGGNQGHASGVAHQNHLISQPFGLDMQVKCTAVVVDDQLRRSKVLFHSVELKDKN